MTKGSIQAAANEFNGINGDTVKAIKSASRLYNRIKEAEIEKANRNSNSEREDSQMLTGNDLAQFVKQEKQRPIIEDSDRGI